MKRILMVVNVMDRGGIETLLMNLYRKIDRNEYQFDFLTHPYDVALKQDYESEIVSMGGRIYKAPRFTHNPLKYRAYIRQLFDEHPEYRIVHGHNLDLAAFVYMPIAKGHGVYLIAHAHCDSERGSKMRKAAVELNHLAIRKYPDHYFACSQTAGEFAFGKDIAASDDCDIFYNGIDVEQYRVDEDTHRQYKQKLFPGVTGPIVGHVGRFAEQKNQTFLLDVFRHVLDAQPDAQLVLLGKGELKDELEEKAKRLGIVDRVLFAGSVPNPSDYLKAMDVFVFPSLYEGLPLSAVEAQAAGLPSLLSDTISPMVKITDDAQFVSLKEPAEQWSQKALTACEQGQGKRHDSVEQIRDAGFDISQISKKLIEFYNDHS